jgi:uncharacterized protein YabE (DUF348 family)
MKLIVDVQANGEDKEIRETINSVTDLVDERDMLADENYKMAKFLLADGYTQDDVDNIAKGFAIDVGGRG